MVNAVIYKIQGPLIIQYLGLCSMNTCISINYNEHSYDYYTIVYNKRLSRINLTPNEVKRESK